LLTRWDDVLSAAQVHAFEELLRRALDDEPLAYLTGERAFFDIMLHVTPDVLIPRPETEHLVEEALAWAQARPGPLRMVDVGTGSGAIAIALARRLPLAYVCAIDISPAALAVAQSNARRYAVDHRLLLVNADLLEACAGPLDLVVANLPYIDPAEWDGLPANVRRYEPPAALLGGSGGTAVIERLIAQLPSRLAQPGLALLECDPQQASALASHAREALPHARVSIARDLAGWDRVLRIARE